MLLMIPGPIEVSPAVIEAFSGPPPGHLAAHVIEAHGASISQMRQVWKASDDAQPFIVPGGGTLAMEMAVQNTVEPGDTVLVVNTGYFSDRIGEMAARRGATVEHVRAEVGEAPAVEAVARKLAELQPSVVFATHVDTSTGVRIDPAAICEIVRGSNALTVFDGVCATVGERFEMAEWGADVYLTASQKAIGLPPGLALMVASKDAMERRRALREPVPMALDWDQWLPIMQAYEDRRPSYFSTPATSHIVALDVGLKEILAEGIDAAFDRHQTVADAMRSAWSSFGLELLPGAGLAANTLSAVRYPDGVGPDLVGEVKARGVVVAGGLLPGWKPTYFRVGHMGYSATRSDHLVKTVRAVGDALIELGHPVDVDAGAGHIESVFA